MALSNRLNHGAILYVGGLGCKHEYDFFVVVL